MKNHNDTFVIAMLGFWAFDRRADFLEYLHSCTAYPVVTKHYWPHNLEHALGQGFEVALPVVPNRQGADYEACSIWFEKFLPHIGDRKLVLVGESMGSLFLVKYLTEHKLATQVEQLHLVCPPVQAGTWTGESVGDFAFDEAKLPHLSSQVGDIFLYGSKNDHYVPFWHIEKYAELLPKAKVLAFDDRGHFGQEDFSELVENIKS